PDTRTPHSFPTRRSSDLTQSMSKMLIASAALLLSLISCKKEEMDTEKTNQEFYTCHETNDWNEAAIKAHLIGTWNWKHKVCAFRSEEHTSELQSRENLVC